jgi:ATP-dependent RNA helicase DeaD
MDVAAAAVKLAHELGGVAVDEEEVPDAAPPPPRRERPAPRRGGGEGMTRLFVGAGRAAGIRPQDLVGAIANESGLGAREIGAIEIADRFSLVEVPEPAADDVIAALRQTTIKGRRANVRRERFPRRA